MPKKIHVTQLIQTFDLLKGGGVTRFAIELAQKLDAMQFQVGVSSLQSGNTDSEQLLINDLNEQGIRAYTAAQWNDKHPYQDFAKANQGMVKDLRRRPVDILHSHSEFTDILLIMVKLRRKAPIIMRTSHYGFAKEWRKRPLRRALFTNFFYPLLLDSEIGINPSMRDYLNNRFLARLLNRQALYVNTAVQLERLNQVQFNIAEKKRSLGIQPDAIVIGCVGRLVEQKGYPYFLKAAGLVLRQEPGIQFVIVGDGPLAEDLKAQATDLGILGQIIFTGARWDIEQILPCLDIFALASLWEGMPLSILESMASNVPIVATNVAGTRDLIDNGVNGLLVPPADAIALSQAILNLIKMPKLRQSLAKNAQETVQQFSMDRVAQRYTKIYHSLYEKYHKVDVSGILHKP